MRSLLNAVREPLEWTNLAGRPELQRVKAELVRWLLKVNAPDAPRNMRDNDD